MKSNLIKTFLQYAWIVFQLKTTTTTSWFTKVINPMKKRRRKNESDQILNWPRHFFFFVLDIFFHLQIWAFDRKKSLFLQLIFNDWCSNQISDTSFLDLFNGFRSCRDIKRILKNLVLHSFTSPKRNNDFWHLCIEIIFVINRFHWNCYRLKNILRMFD